MRIMVIIIVVLLVGAIFIANSQSTNFKNPGSTWLFTKTFFRWTAHIVANVKDVFVQASNLTWAPDVNSTNISKFENKTIGIIENLTN